MKVLKSILVQFFTGINIATILLLWACCAVPYLSPEIDPRLGVFVLLFPAFLVANILFIPFWLIFKLKRLWLPLVGLGVCFSPIRDYIPLNWQGETPDSTLTVLSYNTRGFGGAEANLEDGSNRVMNYLLASDADIICLQEASKKSNYIQLMTDAGYEHFMLAEFLIFSRLHILSADTISLPQQHAHCLRAFLLDGQDTLMLINQHLQSNKLSPQIKEAYREAITEHHQDSLRKGLMPMFRLLAAAAPHRGLQADSVQSLITSWLPRPVILCGDFNDTPISYTHRVLTQDLKSAFRESGNGLGFTFHEKGFPVRIDHILYDGEHWKSYDTQVDDTITCSDHFPIRTKLYRNTTPQQQK